MQADYLILSANSGPELQKEVIKYLREGYQLVGGHQVTTVGYGDYTNAQNAIREIRPNKWEITQAVYRPEIKEEIKKEKVII